MNKTVKKSLLAISTLLTVSAATYTQADVTLIEESLVTDQGLYFWYANGDKAYHYAPNISPRGDCLTVVNGFAYFGWYKGGMNNRKLMLSRKRIGSGDWVSVEFPHQNKLIQPGNKWGDSHRTVAVSVSEKDGTIHMLFDHHNDPLNYIVSKKNLAFASDELFSQVTNYHNKREYLAEGQNLRITYPTLVENDDGDIVVHYRKGSAVGGNEMVHVYNGDTWTPAKQVTRGGGLPHVAVEDRNYAYGKAAFGNGDVYYAFSVRWAAKKPLGILNEGVYLAKTGPTMTDQWEDPNGVKHPLPIQDYSPFLIDLPVTHDGTGSSSGPGISVSDDGGIHLTYRARTSNTDYHYTYSRQAGETSFTKHVGKALAGMPYENKLYRATASSSGLITISSTEVGSINDQPELTIQTPNKFGNTVSRIENGRLVLIAEDRSVQTDSQNLFSYIFDLTDGEPLPPIGPIGPVDPTPIEPPTPSENAPVVNFAQDSISLIVGYQNLYLDIAASASEANSEITSVELYINDTYVRKEGVAPYEWGHGGRTELLGLPIGSHIFKAVATDSKGNTGESTMIVNVLSESEFNPLVIFPSSEMTVTEGYPELVLDIKASSPLSVSSIANVQLYINDTFVRQESVAPYEWGHANSPDPQETTGLAVGVHTFKAIARDRAGNETTEIMKLTVLAKDVFGDLDKDGDVDRNDVRAFSSAVRTGGITDMRYDFNADGLINSRDVRGVALLCTRSGCATE
ncbi:BNR-4 repeat-containing protein [Paraglaciecola aquimarina]|uniref:BNR-4 repeat-containing protein n=1 Tax=Paraglaciecola algarum TaxID=3050085 RepID=A0ABS9D7B7_9ALTE|nr:BNR-4 repeat-containing protein [Paraglaciecola sp. G1-23]MCF2948841.1 BNR-4 repeat-containing protein [Paraglaciecola sp. G1-23]